MSRVVLIGEEIEIEEDFDMEINQGQGVIKVKKGDKAVVNSNGDMEYVTGDAKGVLQGLENEVKGYDNESISVLLYNALNNEFPLWDMLEDEGIDEDSFTSVMESVLNKILK